MKNSKEHVYSPSEDFDMGYTLSLMSDKTTMINKVSSLRATVIKDETVTVYSEKTKQFLRCNNILFEDRR